MTEYKNPFEDPEAELFGIKIKDYKIPERKETPLEKEAEKVPEIKGYIYVPSIGLYVAKKKSFYGLNWYDAHKELHKKGMRMLTIRQFIDFLRYLEKNPSVRKKIRYRQIDDGVLDNSKEERWRGEWLDAKFSEKGGQMYVSYNHKIENGELVAKNVEPLEKCLMKGKYFGSEDYYVDLKSCNKQGLPTRKDPDYEIKSFYESFYWYPEGKGSVAGFVRTSIWAGLHCRLGPTYLFPSLGVRAAFKARQCEAMKNKKRK